MEHIRQQVSNCVEILKLNRDKAFTQKELAAYLKTSRSKIIKIEKGECFDLNDLTKYANILGYDVELLIKEKL